jgi:hypothetical protein
LCFALSQKAFVEPEHPAKYHLMQYLQRCKINVTYCDLAHDNITVLATQIANDYSGLLQHDIAQTIFQDAFYYIDPRSTLGARFNHILAVLAFSQGNVEGAQQYWDSFNASDLVHKRSLGAQVLMKGGDDEAKGITLMLEYTSLLMERFQSTLQNTLEDILIESEEPFLSNPFAYLQGKFRKTLGIPNKEENSTQILVDLGAGAGADSSETDGDGDGVVPLAKRTESEKDLLLTLLLSEAQGGIRKHSRLTDIGLYSSDITEMDTLQRFRLSVGLAKLGLFDLSLRHVWLSATPWEAPLYVYMQGLCCIFREHTKSFDLLLSSL